MTTLAPGNPAPPFSAADQDGKRHTLSDYAGKRVILFFYPRDDTPGCTKEACGFRDNMAQFEGLDAVVLGVSKDTEASHKRFADKFDLNFPLLADVDGAMCEAYGTWVEKKNYGRTYMGIQRSTFLIGPTGTLEKVWATVKPADHAAEVEAALQALPA